MKDKGLGNTGHTTKVNRTFGPRRPPSRPFPVDSNPGMPVSGRLGIETLPYCLLKRAGSSPRTTMFSPRSLATVQRIERLSRASQRGCFGDVMEQINRQALCFSALELARSKLASEHHELGTNFHRGRQGDPRLSSGPHSDRLCISSKKHRRGLAHVSVGERMRPPFPDSGQPCRFSPKHRHSQASPSSTCGKMLWSLALVC